jgi:hypothetical protein
LLPLFSTKEFFVNRKELKSRLFTAIVLIFTMGISFTLYGKIGQNLAVVEVILLVALAYTVAPVAAQVIGKRSGELFTGSSRKVVSAPLLSKAEALVKQHKYEEATELYLSIQNEFPYYLPLYYPLLDLLYTKLDQPEKGRQIYKEGWMAVTESERKTLQRLFKEYSQE